MVGMSAIDYREIFERAAVGIAINDPESGTVGPVNDHYAELLGYPRDVLEDMAIEEISAEDPTFDQERAMAKIEEALAGEPQRFDWLFERKDGTHFWGEVVLKRTESGVGERLLAFVRDVSDRRQYEAELERNNQRLDEFVRIVSHDLQSPLTVARGRLALAQDGDPDQLDGAERALDRMEELIEELLALAQSGDDIGSLEPVDLSAVVRGCWEQVPTGDAELDVTTDATIEADPQRFRQLLENLLKNAAEHAGDDITVRVGGLDGGFFVEDDGAGVPPEERDAVMEPGYTTAEGGTGFWLNIVRDIADAHGWNTTLTNSPEGGARFEFAGVRQQ
jgi:PAS domain S-box-containing protein